MMKSITNRRCRVLALSFALAWAAMVSAAPASLAAGSACGPTARVQNGQHNSVYPDNSAYPYDKYIDPRTGIEQPYDPATNG